MQPRESSWFGFWDGDTVVPLRQQRLYREDWLGLRALDRAGRLVLDTVPGAAHMQFTLEWFEESVIRRYLAEGAETAAPGLEEEGAGAQEGEAGPELEVAASAAAAVARGGVAALLGGGGADDGGVTAAATAHRRLLRLE